MESFHWSPLDLIEKHKLNLGNYALIILNRPIIIPPEEVLSLWNGATIRSTVDGGTNRWFKFLKENNLQIENKYPDILSGDFDSIPKPLLEECEKNGVYIEKTPDQNYTDFEKAIGVIVRRLNNKKLDSLVAIVDNSGRLDHTFSNLNVLSKIPNIFSNCTPPKAYLLTSVSIIWLLTPGEHKISIPAYIRDSNEWCGILPFDPVKNHIYTTGLKWNLDNHSIEMGGLISSSNTYDGSPEVTLKTDSTIIWCMGLGREN